MFIRASESEYVPVCTPLSFGDWITDGHELGWPTEDDLYAFPPSWSTVSLGVVLSKLELAS